MIPDVKIKDYYLKFIFDAKTDAVKYRKDKKLLKEALGVVVEYIETNKDIYKEKFDINLIRYEQEWVNKEYNPTEHLYNTCIKLLRTIEEHTNRVQLVQIIKFCNILRQLHNLDEKITLTYKRKDLTFKQYRDYVRAYYHKVHENLLNGFGYKFSHGIGTYYISYWKIDRSLNVVKRRIDYHKTNQRKAEIIAQGLKPYDKREAEWYKARNIPYDGVDYRIYQDQDYYYEFEFKDSKLFPNGTLEFQHTEYVHLKYRGLGYKDLADILKTDEELYNANVDLKYKLNMYLYKYPYKYINFIRDANPYKYKYRTNNS